MTTVEKPEYLYRVDYLKSVPARIHGLSMEPLLADFPTFGEHADGIDLVIVGGESGPNHRTLNLDAVRRLRDESKMRDIAFHFKQIGGRFPNSNGCLLDGVEYKEFPKAA
jgi:protein gp37